MEKRKISLLALTVFATILVLFTSVSADTGNIDTLCGAIVQDLNDSGGCINSSGVQSTFTSGLTVFTLEFAGLAGLAILGIVSAFGVGIFVKSRSKMKK